MFKQFMIIAVVAGVAMVAAAGEIPREKQLEKVIFVSGKSLPVEEMKAKLDELEAIYQKQDKEGIQRDSHDRWVRHVTGLLAMLGEPMYTRCEEMKTYGGLVSMLDTFENSGRATDKYISHYYDVQRDMCNDFEKFA